MNNYVELNKERRWRGVDKGQTVFIFHPMDYHTNTIFHFHYRRQEMSYGTVIVFYEILECHTFGREEIEVYKYLR